MRTPWLAFFTNKIIFSWSSGGVLEKLRKFKNATRTPSGVTGALCTNFYQNSFLLFILNVGGHLEFGWLS